MQDLRFFDPKEARLALRGWGGMENGYLSERISARGEHEVVKHIRGDTQKKRGGP